VSLNRGNDYVMACQGYNQNIPLRRLDSSCRKVFLEGEDRDLLPQNIHYCLISHRKKSPKGITRNTLLPIIETQKKANKRK
jgi:hypothetical protein